MFGLCGMAVFSPLLVGVCVCVCVCVCVLCFHVAMFYLIRGCMFVLLVM